MSYDFYPMYMLKDCQSSMLSLTLFKECDQDLKVDMGCDGYIVHIAANCLSWLQELKYLTKAIEGSNINLLEALTSQEIAHTH